MPKKVPKLTKRTPFEWEGSTVPPGEFADVELKIGETHSGITLRIPIRIYRGLQPGPSMAVTAALHGDELNGTGAIRELIAGEQLKLRSGTLILVPVLNVLAFQNHSRYLPDRRDLNRSFPGSAKGSMASRLGRRIFKHIVGRADVVVDLHTAAIRRTNYPNIRADMSHAKTAELARAFGSELIIDCSGPRGSLRREAVEAGVPTITFEGGEIWKVEPSIVACILRGLNNLLVHYEMIEGTRQYPLTRRTITESKWVRAEHGGFLQFHIAPGDVVEAGQALITNTELLGHENNVLTAPWRSVVIGMTTVPVVSPGEAICHLGKLYANHPTTVDDFTQRIQEQLATNVLVVDRPLDDPTDHKEG